MIDWNSSGRLFHSLWPLKVNARWPAAVLQSGICRRSLFLVLQLCTSDLVLNFWHRYGGATFLKFWFQNMARARKATGTFQKRAPGQEKVIYEPRRHTCTASTYLGFSQWHKASGSIATLLPLHNPCQNSLKQLYTFRSLCSLEMWLQSNADTTTLQKGSGKRKGAKFSKVFQGFCPRLKLISVRETNCVNQWFIWGIKLSMFLASGARVRDTKLCPISCPKNINDTANGPLQI